ncbi:NAD(P)/FAD-dependent oxidoreductase [Candidatus Peregrinibacteria bacterium]|nr:NAD(P)/FAD-dependent oxidoreductase [Candidatus Peregrinibacteria bacterium]
MNMRIGIIGGGAAGMMAAAAVKEGSPEAEVTLFEKNKYLGAKVSISGGGRCNVTTGIFDVRKLLENYPRGAKFLMSAMFRFPPEKVMEWFEAHGVKLKIEEDLRVFPKSDVGKDVVNALQAYLQSSGVKVLLGSDVVSVVRMVGGHAVSYTQSSNDLAAESSLNIDVKIIKPDQISQEFQITLKDGQSFMFDSLIITTGGNAYRHTGSTGDGYAFAKALGHTVTPLAPSLNSFIMADSWVKSVAGVSFEKAKIIFHGIVKKYERTGAFVFTHYGISGPAVFALSSAAAYETYSKEKPMKLTIDLFPEESPENLLKRVNEMILKLGRKSITNFVDMFLPKSLCPVVVKLLKIDESLQAAQLSKEQRKLMVQYFKQLPFTVIGRGAGDEFVTAGGVPLSEVNTNTMESKICPGLYFAGEILDIDGFTGGFNLQASWATGRLAGESCAGRDC